MESRKEMKFRKAELSDIHDILDIICEARSFLKEQGVDQWQNGYPDYNTVKNDIEAGVCHVLTEGGKVVGTAAVIFGEEKTYLAIYDGKWLTNGDYATIHRLAVGQGMRGKGASSELIKHIESMCLREGIFCIRTDTHRDNLPMQGLLKKNGYSYCGVIYLEDGSERLAYEKML